VISTIVNETATRSVQLPLFIQQALFGVGEPRQLAPALHLLEHPLELAPRF